jgi:hypothetical protein
MLDGTNGPASPEQAGGVGRPPFERMPIRSALWSSPSRLHSAVSGGFGFSPVLTPHSTKAGVPRVLAAQMMLPDGDLKRVAHAA